MIVVEVFEEAVHARRFQVFADTLNRLELKTATRMRTPRHLSLIGIKSVGKSLVFVAVVVFGTGCILSGGAPELVLGVVADRFGLTHFAYAVISMHLPMHTKDALATPEFVCRATVASFQPLVFVCDFAVVIGLKISAR